MLQAKMVFFVVHILLLEFMADVILLDGLCICVLVRLNIYHEC